MKVKLSRAAFLKLNPCEEARDWVKASKGNAAQLWNRCQRGDWMLWLLARVRPLSKVEAVTLACRFALEVLPIFEKRFPEDKRPRLAIEAAENWLKNPSSAAAYAARAADAAARAAYAADAAYAARAADAAYAAAYAADAAARAAYAARAADAAYAADAAAYAAYATDATQRKKQADIIRELIGNPFK